MSFETLLEYLLGPREVIHEVECSVCGGYETYYRDPITKKNLGRACNFCGDVQAFELD
ncbi:acyltransferase [Neobacillus niacini]|uniref:acyltransferase n=1 Tax=Neobacillus niacini TaxID=86668 RepID=UPI003001DD8B